MIFKQQQQQRQQQQQHKLVQQHHNHHLNQQPMVVVDNNNNNEITLPEVLQHLIATDLQYRVSIVFRRFLRVTNFFF